MLVARLNRDKLRLLSDSRLEEGRVLLENKLWTGSYYMTGLAVECALKAYLAQAVGQHDFPDKNFVARIYTHKLKELAQLDAAFWLELETEIKANVKLRTGTRCYCGMMRTATSLLMNCRRHLYTRQRLSWAWA